MAILSRLLRRQLETAIKQAREIAEAAAKEAIERAGVAAAEAPPRVSSDDKRLLRRRLRAHGRTLGDARDTAGVMATARLQDAAAYELWHRMLFGRFLAERGLLIHPDLGAAISITELRELAQDEGAADEWALAERYAAPGLPGVFKPDDPVLTLPVAPEFSKRLRAVLSGLPEAVFTADDSLGWTYQFWRASEKEAINQAGGKIGATELPAVTQLFTEPYMVKFLLHNTLGAWWAGKVLALDPGLARDATDEDTLRGACAVPGVAWEFLRFVREDDDSGTWRPAAGVFSGWPIHAAEITYCDPCCGSGHFLVEAFSILSALRQKEERLSARDAAVAVLCDNLHGLEIDGRCVQIAAFNVALAAWKLAGAPVPLPSPHIAWVGAPPPMLRDEMAALANGDAALRGALEKLHDRFAQAPLLGSLLEISAQDLLDTDLLERGGVAFAELRRVEPERFEGAVAARGLFDASALLTRQYILLATNVPFLLRRKQIDEVAKLISDNKDLCIGKPDLATTMLARMRRLAAPKGTIASVMPQSWLFLGAYKMLRGEFLDEQTFHLVCGLGSRAFQTIGGEVVNTALIILSNGRPEPFNMLATIDANEAEQSKGKADALQVYDVVVVQQSAQRLNPDMRIGAAVHSECKMLADFAVSPNGMHGADAPRFRQKFWEHMIPDGRWVPFQTTVESTMDFGGREHVFDWLHDGQTHHDNPAAYVKGMAAWGRDGVTVSMMSALPVTRYTGERFDISCSPIVPFDPAHLPAIWAFCSSPKFYASVRRIDRALKVTNATLVKIPFDLPFWEKAAAEHYPTGLPAPYSDCPTQWLFHGHPSFAESGTELHVALARLAGYRWPAETDTTIRLADNAKERIALAACLPKANADGLLLLHSNGINSSLADQLRILLTAAYGAPLSLADEQALVRAADARLDRKEAKDRSLEGWIADRAFRQHCILFQQRPFLWQVIDGSKDGFSAFLYYHRLNIGTLNKLTYTLLGDWIRIARGEGQTARLERAEKLQQTLAKIIEGETPLDVFVRWKTPARQPLGWEPDLDDGVRLNIRPFMTAGVLREQPKGIHWNKDRGTDVASAPWFDLGRCYGGKQGDRINDHHTTLAEKRVARGGA